MEIIVAKTREQIEFCKEIIFAFRPEVEEATYLDLIMHMITDENYILAYLPNHDNTKAAAFIGYRTKHMLLTGRMIYVDDLYTDPAYRGGGFAGKLLDFVASEATQAGIKTIHLDSGYDLHDAHRLYLNNRYVLACNHFARIV
ncbi:GNAT family N-acetyltransferase [Dyadobacter chenhuakuii]|uniref:GNAT family N-acetyltransferase n=1 Tax=Dyadobacter chenhuakuii TaxID=2909339 RepID=A0A9X1QIY2_9BACT|nr:GNAT family N-acetyltransferase [Dyadobacter chenhuakuii]MCF2501312.1 GNAT family N-acetyltransferase [Dyadobacter chenhuakuii]